MLFSVVYMLFSVVYMLLHIVQSLTLYGIRTISAYRFTRVVFGLTSSPFILNATLKHHVTQHANVDPDFVNEVLRSLYVDDFASGSRDVKTALQLSTKVKTRLTDG